MKSKLTIELNDLLVDKTVAIEKLTINVEFEASEAAAEKYMVILQNIFAELAKANN